MTHATAFSLVSEICPDAAGKLWNTTAADGCDTANAVANQYAENETDAAREALEVLAAGGTPDGWEVA